jgi:hypothetical protein
MELQQMAVVLVVILLLLELQTRVEAAVVAVITMHPQVVQAVAVLLLLDTP